MHKYKAGEMLANLEAAIKILPGILDKRESWDSLIVNRRKPYTYRVFTKLPNGLRLCLHKFDTCHTHEAFAHPHPWPGAFTVMQGSYKMMMGYSRGGREDRDFDETGTFILHKGSSYEIINPMTWHAVIPLETTYTIMINDEAWPAEFAHTEVRTTKGKDLDKMPENELIEHLSLFKQMVSERIK